MLGWAHARDDAATLKCFEIHCSIASIPPDCRTSLKKVSLDVEAESDLVQGQRHQPRQLGGLCNEAVTHVTANAAAEGPIECSTRYARAQRSPSLPPNVERGPVYAIAKAVKASVDPELLPYLQPTCQLVAYR